MPPREDITNDNIEDFFVQCWDDGSKPNVTQGHRYINHILTNYGMPPLNKHHRQRYASVLDLLQGLQREKKWRDHVSQGADPMSRDTVKKLLLAKVHDANGEINYRKLRNKVLSNALLLCGWHPKDAWRVMDSNVIDIEDFHDRDGHLRPKFLFNDLSHNKRPKYKVFNTIGCGCKGEHHTKNVACPYNLITWYQRLKDEFDDHLMRKKKRLSRQERLRHFDENGNLKERKFFRSITKGGCREATKRTTLHEHRNMGFGSIQGVFEFWRPVLDLGDIKMTTDQARRTFCTLGHKYTGRNFPRCSSSCPRSNSWR